jgi:mRNA interferase MazF
LMDEWKRIQEELVFWENSQETKVAQKVSSWSLVKKEISKKKQWEFYINEREVWFVRLWENIWFEQSWKWKEFRRPVLVLKRAWTTFFCLPLTKWWKDNKFYHKIKSIDFWMDSKVILSQWKVLDKKRFFQHLWEISEEEFLEIKKLLTKFLLEV